VIRASFVLLAAFVLPGGGTLAAEPVPGPVTGTVLAPSVPGYVIGSEDALEVTYWRDTNLSALVTVRPDGFITLPLLGDVEAAGLTPSGLSARIETLATAFVKSPAVIVSVRQANSLRAFIMGEVARPGLYVLRGPTTVLQLIAMAGGLTEYADRKHIRIVGAGPGTPTVITVNYEALVRRGRLEQNAVLKAGDTVLVR